MIDLVVATTNCGKLAELRELLPGEFNLLTLADVGLTAPEETGETFEENARLKALTAARQSGRLALADDSGLEVGALGGAPGVRSARFAGEPTDDRRNYERVLELLSSDPDTDREARFRCVVALADPDGVLAVAEGACIGRIVAIPRGSHGFGYDPIVELENGKTVAELTPSEKNLISHRSRAVSAIRPALLRIVASKSRDVTQ